MVKITSKVKMETSFGDIVIGLYGEDAPITVKNFEQYVGENFYDGLIFHRIIPNFVAQGGGFYPKMEQKETNPPIKLEIAKGLLHEKYVLSMARTQVRDSATSQFFICFDRVPHLDNQYAVFGKVIEGMDVIDKMAAVKTGSAGFYQDVPVEDIVINKAYMV